MKLHECPSLEEYRRVVPDFQMSDVSGSGFEIRDYHVHDNFCGDGALRVSA